MWSASPASNENQIPATQTAVHRKSVGRTPLKALGDLDPNNLNNQRLSHSKPSSNTNILDKEAPLVSAGVPVSIWVDSCPDDDSLANSATPSTFSMENKELHFNVTESFSDMKTEQECNKPCDSVLDSELVSSDQAQEAVLENPDNKCVEEEYNAHVLVRDSLDDETFTDDQQAVSTDVPGQITFDVCSNTIAAKLPETSADFHEKSSFNKVNLCLSDNALYCAALPAEDKECAQVTDDIDFTSESNTVSLADKTYEVSLNFDGESKDCFFPLLPSEFPDLVQIVENWVMFGKQDKESFPFVPDMDNGYVGHDSHATKSAPSLLGDMTKDKPEQIVDDPSTLGDSAVVLDKLDSIFSHVILGDECSLVTSHPADTLIMDGEFSTCSVENSTENGLDMGESTNKCFFPIGGSTPQFKQQKSGATKVTNTDWATPSSNLHHSSFACDPQRSKGVAASDKCNCPSPGNLHQSRPHDVLSLSRHVCNNVIQALASFREVGTSVSPKSTAEEMTWTTPVMLLNKSMNTSWNLQGKGVKSAKDNACETDSLLWNFSKETLCNATREELIHRLEGTLIVVEVLSRQLQGWQQQPVTSKPSEQREASTQTCVMHASEAECYYRNLYFKTLSKQQSLQRCHEDEKRLQEVLQEATEYMASYKSEADAMVKYAANLYETVQKDRSDINQKVSCTRSLLSDYMTSLSKMHKKLQNSLLEKEAMKSCMEEALLAKKAADQFLEDFEVHSSAVVAQLRSDLETERNICETVREAYEQQSSYNEELDEFVQKACSVCSEMEEDRTRLLIQCSEAKELMSRHWHLFRIMKEKTQMALEHYDVIKDERDIAVLENNKMSSRLEDLKSLNEQMKLENSRLGSELESLMERLCSLESEIDQWKEDNSELAEQLSARDSSLKLLEKELNEATARGQAYQERIKHLAMDVVPSLKLELSDVTSQKEALQSKLQALKKEHASQITTYTESLEFLEQENHVCREQVAETESQLKTHHLNLLERNYQFENLKDTVKELEKEVTELKQKLADADYEAENMKAKASKEISNASNEFSKIKTNLLDVIRNLKANSQREVKVHDFGQHTPGGSLTHSNNFMEESFQTTSLNAADSEDPKAEGIWSETSAFTVVQPVPSQLEGTAGINLPDLLNELSSVASNVVTASSLAMNTKQDFIRNLNMNIYSLKEEIQNQGYQHNSDLRNLEVELGSLRKRHCELDEKLTIKEKYIGELQDLVHQREQKILQQITKMNESEDLVQENSKLKLSLKQRESEVEVLRRMLSQDSTAMEKNWIEESVMMHKDLTALNIKLSDAEKSKSEAIQRLMRHKDILTANLSRSEAELQKLDAMIEKIREALLSVPEVVNQCDTLRQLMESLN